MQKVSFGKFLILLGSFLLSLYFPALNWLSIPLMLVSVAYLAVYLWHCNQSIPLYFAQRVELIICIERIYLLTHLSERVHLHTLFKKPDEELLRFAKELHDDSDFWIEAEAIYCRPNVHQIRVLLDSLIVSPCKNDVTPEGICNHIAKFSARDLKTQLANLLSL